MINFLHKQVITDCFFMSFMEFEIFYRETYGLDSFAAEVIWYGVRERRGTYPGQSKSSGLGKEELEKLKSEVLMVMASGKEPKDKVEVEKKVKVKKKTKKVQYVELREEGLPKHVIKAKLEVSSAYMKHLTDWYKEQKEKK